MWFLLSIITSYINRNCIPEFSDLFEILFKDEEILPNPDLNTFNSVIKLAPLSIWIHLNLRLQTQTPQENTSTTNSAQAQTNKSSKSLVLPEILKNHSALLQECMNTQHFKDYGLSICMNAYSTETTFFSPPFNSLLDKIGKNAIQQQQSNIINSSGGSVSPNGTISGSIFTNHQALSFEMIGSFTLHVRMQ